jgi:penicillin-binding protein 1A
MSRGKSKSQIMKQRARRERRGAGRRLTKWLAGLTLLALVSLVLAAGGLYYYMSQGLPKISSLSDYRPSTITTVYSDDNRRIAEFFKERRIVVPLEDLPEMLRKAFIAAEDSRFYKHRGVDLLSIVRAFFKNMEAGTIVQGGSTITQQVTKSFFLTPERSYRRKIKEAILAYRIDQALSKEEILYLYLNQIYLGHGAYGVQAAAENYFGKSAKDLSLAECAMLAGLPQAPSRYSPFHSPEKAQQRQIYVLNRMTQEGYITNVQASEALTQELDIRPRRNLYIEEVPFYTEYVRQYVLEKYGEDALYREGLKIYTAVNIETQTMAREEVLKGLKELDKREGYRGPLKHLQPEQIENYLRGLRDDESLPEPVPGQMVQGVVVALDDQGKTVGVRLPEGQGRIAIADMRWARKPNPEIAYHSTRIERPGQVLRVGDVIWVGLKARESEAAEWPLTLEQEPEAQSALLCMESESGQVKAMVGGRDFRENQFNRAIQSRRQPGSAFKPIVYAAALDKGYTPATVIYDSPVVYKDVEMDFKWKPKNYGREFHGPTLLRKALAKSYNVVTVKILRDIGIDYVIEYARRLGIESNINRDLSIGLGSAGMSLLEIVRAYAVFNHQGYLIEPVFITRIEDRDGNLLEKAGMLREKVMESSTAYIMTSLLEGVVKEGTGRRVRALRRPVAGKTGTTNNLQDAWFVGYTPRYTTGVWVGYDDSRPMGQGETGSRAASPIWLGFMQRLLEGKPVRVFQVPQGVVFAKIDGETGLLPVPESQTILFECFKEGTAPTEYTKRPGKVADTDQFYKKGI